MRADGSGTESTEINFFFLFYIFSINILIPMQPFCFSGSLL
jgi:hypothetical protein